jgi:hypothetical protein
VSSLRHIVRAFFTWRGRWIGYILHLSYLVLKVGHSATMIHPRSQRHAHHDDRREYYRHNVPVSSLFLLLDVAGEELLVAIFA